MLKERENPNMGDQLVVRVGRGCNFKCNFCNVSINERHVKLRENIDDIVRNFHYKMKYSSFKNKGIEITISGGEPSIYKKETYFALKYISKFLGKREINHMFGIQTNASGVDLEFSEKIYSLGIESALVSFHTNDKKIFEETLGISYEKFFPKVLEGIDNLIRSGIYVDTNTILSHQNKENFLQTIEFLLERFPEIYNFNIGIIQPHGEAERNFKEVTPIYEQVAPIYNEAIKIIQNKGKKVTSHFVGLPLCYLDDHDVSLEKNSNQEFRKNFNFSEKYLINDINDINKKQTDDCRKCMYNNVCSGIWKNYVGKQELKPFEYVIDYFGDFTENQYCYKLKSFSEPLEELFQRGILQLIVPDKLGSSKDIFSVIKKATSLGFYKITLLIGHDFQYSNDLLLTGVTNIQLFGNRFNINNLKTIYKFSKINKPQFDIDVDVILTQKELQTIPKGFKKEYGNIFLVDESLKTISKVTI